jgi:hypothetical protein
LRQNFKTFLDIAKSIGFDRASVIRKQAKNRGSLNRNSLSSELILAVEISMPLYEIFSKRKSALLKQSSADVYKYDYVPKPLRIQIMHVWHEAIGNPNVTRAVHVTETYHEIVQILRKEWAVTALTPSNRYPYDKDYSYGELIERLHQETNADRTLDIVELGFVAIDRVVRGHGWINERPAEEIADEAISEMNSRFKEHAIGYQYHGGQLIRIDSELTHQEIVKPALTVLNDKAYAAAEAEFLKAHAHYRKGELSDTLIECCKAFESTMKIICAKRKWPVDKNATASVLVKTCLDNGLIPNFWQGHFAGLKNILESAVPTPRNKLGGHGARTTPGHSVSEELAGYVINMTAATILFLTRAEKATE